jgi:hypothetical protein
MDPPAEDRRKGNRRKKMVRNLFSYFNRRNLFRRGRRRDEWRYEQEDWFDAEAERSGNPPPAED